MATEYIHLNYTKAKDVAQMMERSANTSGASRDKDNNLEPNGLLSSQGSIIFDERTNVIVVNDHIENIQKIRTLVAVVDIPVRQVMVEARIVRANTNFSKELGVRWGLLASRDNNKWNIGGSTNTLWNLREQSTIERPAHLNVDLGVSQAAAGSIALGFLGVENFILDLELSALQSDGYGEIVSTPKVLTVDKQKASIVTGQEVPYQTVSMAGGVATTQVSFKEALLKLDVIPTIMPNGSVQMQLQVTNNSPAGYAQNGEVILNKNELLTNVMVKDGETIVLGGVYEHSQQNTQNKIPILGDIPALGTLFHKKMNVDDKRELLIFITPRILNDTLSRNE